MAFARARFDHVGLISTQEREGERWVESTRVWVTNPRANPHNVEFVRFAPDSPVSGPLRELPHVAYRVDDLDAALEGQQVLLPPFDPTGRGDDWLRVAFVHAEGIIVELMKYANPDEEGWF
jgi:hypothetical protein